MKILNRVRSNAMVSAVILTVFAIALSLGITPTAQAAIYPSDASNGRTYQVQTQIDEKARSIEVKVDIGQNLKFIVQDSNLYLASNGKATTSYELIDVDSLMDENPELTFGNWEINGKTAKLLVSAPLPTSPETRNMSTWSKCIAKHGISGAVKGAITGCVATIGAGCVAGALTSATAGLIGQAVWALWACRGEW